MTFQNSYDAHPAGGWHTSPSFSKNHFELYTCLSLFCEALKIKIVCRNCYLMGLGMYPSDGWFSWSSCFFHRQVFTPVADKSICSVGRLLCRYLNIYKTVFSFSNFVCTYSSSKQLGWPIMRQISQPSFSFQLLTWRTVRQRAASAPYRPSVWRLKTTSLVCVAWATRATVCCAPTLMNVSVACTAVTLRPAATTPLAATDASASMDMLEMAPTARTLMNAKMKMGVAMPVPSAPTMRVGDSANANLVSVVMASCALMLTNALTKESAIGMPPAATTLAPMYAPVTQAIREMETTCVWT